MDRDTFEQVEIRSAAALWSWLSENHDQSDSVWLVTWKAIWRDRYVSRDEVLDALIAYGWIDGRRMKLDDDRTMQLVSPRKQQVWAQTYKDRAQRLESEGRMHPAGIAVLERDRRSGLFDAMSDIDRLEDPEDLVSALKASGGDGWWSAAAPSYRRNTLRWIASAKGVETRAKRILIASNHAAAGKKVPQY